MNRQIDNGMKLFEYLEKLSLLNTSVRKNIKNLSKEEEIFNLENKDFLPALNKIFLKNRDTETDKQDNLFFSIERYKIENPPKLPKQLEKWIDFESISFIKPEPKNSLVLVEKFVDSKERMKAFLNLTKDDSKRYSDSLASIIKEWVIKNDDGEYEKIYEKSNVVYFNDFPNLKNLYKDWLLRWEVWKNKNYEYFISNQAYDKFYSLRSFLKTEDDSYDLLWGHDILAWKQNGKEVYHPTFFTPVSVKIPLFGQQGKGLILS